MTDIKEYSETEAAISKLREQYSEVPDVGTKSGLELCKKQYKAVRKFEIDLDKKRKELGAAARKHLDMINSEAKRINGQLIEISGPFKEAEDKRELEIKNAEENRIKSIHNKINEIHNFVNEAYGQTPEMISGIIEALDNIDPSTGFDEFAGDAMKAVNEASEKLATILRETVERVRFEEQQKALQIDIKINDIKKIPIDFMEASKEQIEVRKDALLNLDQYFFSSFGDREPEAKEAVSVAINKLEKLALMAESESKLEPIPASVHTQENHDALFNYSEEVPEDMPSASGQKNVITDQVIVEFLQGQLNDVTDFGYLLVSDDPQHNAEALANLKHKLQVFVGNK